jgi:hypothetical protein
MKRTALALSDRVQSRHAPLAAFGYALRRAGVLDPLEQVQLPIKTVEHTPAETLNEALLLILAGGRFTAQIDLLLRPNLSLAQAWGQARFAQQSTVADALDAFDESAVHSLRQAFEVMLQAHALAVQHDFRTGDLWLDGDLSGLPASRRAQGSTKGYFAGEKTAWAVN